MINYSDEDDASLPEFDKLWMSIVNHNRHDKFKKFRNFTLLYRDRLSEFIMYFSDFDTLLPTLGRKITYTISLKYVLHV